MAQSMAMSEFPLQMVCLDLTTTEAALKKKMPHL